MLHLTLIMYFLHCLCDATSKITKIQINIALSTDRVTPGMLSQNISDIVTSFIANDKGYHLMNPIKGTQAYCKKFFHKFLQW